MYIIQLKHYCVVAKHLLLLLVRCYTVRQVATMNGVVSLRSSTSPCSFRWSIISVADLSWSWLLKFWSICYVIWSSSSHG